MKRFRTASGIIELTDERAHHIATFHPDIILYLKHIPKTLQSPDVIAYSRHDSEVQLFYKYIPRKKKHLVVVVKMNKRNFTLTAYLTKIIKYQT